LWLLIAFLTSSERIDPLIYLSREPEPLERLVKARRFWDWRLEEVEPCQAIPLEESPAERSISDFRDHLPAPYSFMKTLIEAGYVTLGDVAERGSAGLRSAGISEKVIRLIRRRLERLGLRLKSPREGRGAA
jgi:hypothetical protein